MSIKSISVSLFHLILFALSIEWFTPSHTLSPICGANSSKYCCNSLIVTDGYLKLGDNFTVGDRITIDMKIKPRSKSGALLWVAGENDFLILQMINRTVEFVVDNGDGLISASSELAPKVIKDGGWYDISISKFGSMVSLQVDNKDFSITLGQGERSSTDTFGPLLLGGVPKDESVLGLRTSDQFRGCIKDVEISGEKVNLATVDDFRGSLVFKRCPVEA